MGDPQGLQERVEAVASWYHHIELPGGITTPGPMPLDAGAYRFPGELTGKRVLDVGAWDGYWTFEALKRGAAEVVAIDDFSDDCVFPGAPLRDGWKSFELCREALGWTDTDCPHETVSLYELTEERLGRFDLVLLYGVIYHLRYPMLGLDRLAAICDGQIRIESAILDDYSVYRGRGYAGQGVAEFYPGIEYSMNPTNWWVPTIRTLAHWVEAAGFVVTDAWKLTDEAPKELAHCRGFMTARKR